MEIRISELFGVGNAGHFGVKEIHQALHYEDRYKITLRHFHKCVVPLYMTVHSDTPSILFLSMMVELESVSVVYYWMILVLL